MKCTWLLIQLRTNLISTAGYIYDEEISDSSCDDLNLPVVRSLSPPNLLDSSTSH